MVPGRSVAMILDRASTSVSHVLMKGTGTGKRRTPKTEEWSEQVEETYRGALFVPFTFLPLVFIFGSLAERLCLGLFFLFGGAWAKTGCYDEFLQHYFWEGKLSRIDT